MAGRQVSFALRSAAAILFAIVFVWPDLPSSLLVRLFAAYTFTDGVLILASGGWSRSHGLAWPLLLGGCLDIAIAGTVYIWPDLTLPMLADAAAIWAIAAAASLVAACIALREADTDHLLLAGAIVSLTFGRALLSGLATDGVVLSTWLGLYALTIGIVMLKLTLKHSRVFNL
ncbi:MAG TPA: DUF308 domain-containing protein [Stellaceae bacterium]|nr:DUF308 domain-containing protein [Stellaceae bacterium]